MARSGDLHLHTHLVLANRVQGPDGRWTAPDMRPVFAAAKTAGTIADALMRAELTQALGVGWGPVREGIAEITGIPEGVRAHFSARHAEILEEAAVRGWGGSAAALSVLQRETRDHKPRIARERAQAEWRARAAEHGFGRAELKALLARPAPARAPTDAELARYAEGMAGPGGLTARSATFIRSAAIEAFAAAHPHGASAERLEGLADGFLAERALRVAPERTEPGRGRLPAAYTTPAHLLVEARLVEAAAGEDPRGPLVARPEAITAAVQARPTLAPEQERAVRGLCAAPGRVQARAGAGKTYALAAVREAYEASGVP